MKPSTRHLRLLPLLGLLALAACAAETGSDAAADPSAESAEALAQGPGGPPRGGPDGRHGPPGPELLFVAALDALDLTAAQRSTVEKTVSDLRPGAEQGPPERPLFTALADAVRSGRVDADALLAKADAEHARPERLAKLESAIQTLHDTLSPAQRKELVDLLSERMEARGLPGVRGHEGPPGRPHPGRGAERGPLGHLFADLGLSDGQSQSIQAILESDRPAPPDPAMMKQQFEARHAELQARLATFAADGFDAHAFATPPEPKETMGPRRHVESLVRVLARVVPILDPAQREIVAARLLEGPPRGPGGHGGHGRPGAPPPGAPPPASL
jgi:Spy/CpxP family protein refolding chaperone